MLTRSMGTGAGAATGTGGAPGTGAGGAAVCGVSEGTVGATLSQARAALEEVLQEEDARGHR